MPESDAIRAAEHKALRYLARKQQPDGSFISYSSASMRPFRRLRSWQTTFVPALMLAALTKSDLPEAVPMRRELARLLLAQKQPNGAFNYWASRSPEYRAMAYPDDLDDTFCALAALQLHEPGLIDKATLAQSLRLLLATETETGGPYRTWLVAPSSKPVWLDIDLAVNSNIAFFLSLLGSRLPNLDALMGQAIREERFSSPYYPTKFVLLYYLARAYRGPEQSRLLSLIKKTEPEADTDLDRALCVTARHLLDDHDTAPAIHRLLKAQRRDGSWPAAVFYADPDKQEKQYYNGAAELTTAFVIEALAARRTSLHGAEDPEAQEQAASRHTGEVLRAARKQARQVDPVLRRPLFRGLAQLADSREGTEITGFARLCHDSLRQPDEPSQAMLTGLGAANLYGWLAYTIFDDFIDGEGRAALMPIAALALRRSLQGFLEAAPDQAAFRQAVHETFDAIDGANSWELASCRYQRDGNQLRIKEVPDYGDLSRLAERSLGHTLGPTAVILQAGADKRAAAHCREAFKQYLIVRQLNDDLHDWQEDLANGHISYVVAKLLTHGRVVPGSYETPSLVARLRNGFWHSVLPDTCRQMQERLAAGRKELQASDLFVPESPMEKLFEAMGDTVEDTLAKQQQATMFLEEYGKTYETTVRS